MSETAFIADARVMSNGQVTIPKKVRTALGFDIDDRVTFAVSGSQVRLVNSAIYALERFQKQMAGEAETAGFASDEDVAEWITQSRREESV